MARALACSLSGTVYAAEVPEGLAPGASLSLQYLDRYGDLWLDVPRVPDVEVVPPRTAAPGEAPQPCVRAATRWVQREDLVCVCGTFPSPAAWSALLVADRPAGPPVSASESVVTRGNFNVEWTVATPPCLCGGERGR
jgi:hypothetical protein